MSSEIVKLFRPQAGDILIVDFNKVNVTQVENAVKDLKVPVIAVHDINTIQLFGLREQNDFSEQTAKLQLDLNAANDKIKQLQGQLRVQPLVVQPHVVQSPTQSSPDHVVVSQPTHAVSNPNAPVVKSSALPTPIPMGEKHV